MYNMYGGGGMYGGGMGGGGGGGSSQMMSSMSMVCVCFIVLAGAAFMFMKSQEQQAMSDVPVTPIDTTAPSTAVSGLDGTYMILVGALALSVRGSCSNHSVLFRTPSDSKTAWNVRKAGTSSNGKDYYTLQTVYGSFNKICNKQYLTAPSGCKGPPYLGAAASTPQQYWYIEGASGNYTLRNVGCTLSRWPYSYMESSGQVEGKPSFSGRTGSSYQLQPPYTG